MIKPVYLGLSIFELTKIVMYKFFLYDYVKPKYGEKAKLCYMDTCTFIVYIEPESIYTDVAKDVDLRFDTSNYELERSYESSRKIMKKIAAFAALTAKTYIYLTYNYNVDKKPKTQKSVS